MTLFESHEYILRGRVLACFGFLGLGIQPESVEEQFAHLTRTVDIELHVHELVDTLLQFVEFDSQFGLRFAQFAHVESYACVLHRAKNRHKRQFDLIVEIP